MDSSVSVLVEGETEETAAEQAASAAPPGFPAFYRYREIQKARELVQAAEMPENPVGMEEHAALEHTLSQMADSDAKVLRMKYYEGYTAKEIGEILGISHEAVKKRIQRALKKAMALMAE